MSLNTPEKVLNQPDEGFGRMLLTDKDEYLSGFKINIILFLIFLLGFVLILLTGTNQFFFSDINSFAAHTNPFVWSNLTFLGDTMVAGAIILLFIRKRPDLVWSGIAATIAGALIVNLFKYFLDSPRPAAVISGEVINIIGPALYKHSFPSGHTVTIFALAGILLFCIRSFYLKLGVIILAFAVGISRVAVGAHWPADVLAGASIGILSAMTGIYLSMKFRWQRMKTMQLIVGFVLIILDLYFLTFYDIRYEQAVYLKYLIAGTTLVIGIKEYYLLITKH